MADCSRGHNAFARPTAMGGSWRMPVVNASVGNDHLAPNPDQRPPFPLGFVAVQSVCRTHRRSSLDVLQDDRRRASHDYLRNHHQVGLFQPSPF